MRLRPALVAAVATAALFATPSLADLIVPEVEDCRDKKVGDACPGGTCQSDGFSCQAGSCRRFDDEASCKADGCRWVEGLSCRATPTPTPTPTTTPAAATTTTATTTTPVPAPVPGGCSAGPGLATVFALLAFGGWRTRRRR